MKDMISQLKQQIKYEEKTSIHEYIINMLSKEFISNIVADKTKKDNGISEALYEAIVKKFEVANGAFDEMIFDFSKAEMGQVLNLADAVTSFDSKEFTKKINDKDKMDKRVRSIRKRLKNALSEEDAKNIQMR